MIFSMTAWMADKGDGSRFWHSSKFPFFGRESDILNQEFKQIGWPFSGPQDLVADYGQSGR